MTECSPCGKKFSSITAFDMHRVGRHQPLERRCMSEFEMRERGMTLSPKGEWTGPITEASRAALAALARR